MKLEMKLVAEPKHINPELEHRVFFKVISDHTGDDEVAFMSIGTTDTDAPTVLYIYPDSKLRHSSLAHLRRLINTGMQYRHFRPGEELNFKF